MKEGPDRWLVLSVQMPPRGEETLLVEALRSLGAGWVEREGERFVAHLPPPAHVDPFLEEARGVIRASTSLEAPDLLWRWREPGEFEARWLREVRPRRIGRRMVVSAAGDDSPQRAGDVPIRLEPGVAFGTAEHPTTRGCLRFLERLIEGGERIADVGAGSGILSVAAAALGAARVLALEMDPEACRTVARNADANRASDRVEVREMEVRPGDLHPLGPFDGIVANLSPEIILPLLPDFRAAVEGAGTETHVGAGWILLSGMPQATRDTILRAAGRERLELKDEEAEEGWWTALLVVGPGASRRSARRDETEIGNSPPPLWDTSSGGYRTAHPPLLASFKPTGGGLR